VPSSLNLVLAPVSLSECLCAAQRWASARRNRAARSRTLAGALRDRQWAHRV